MIVLSANTELKTTFEKLIRTMEANVSWNGLFVVIDNCLILQGAVRSLFFHFDSRKVLENIIDLPIKEEEILDTAEEPKVWDVINIILYSFGKWGAIKGLRVEKNYDQLNRLFSNVLREVNIEPEYTKEHFLFYQNGIRITYEDVMQAALEAEEKLPEDSEEEAAGLWHKVAWKKEKVVFEKEETTMEERRKGRLGNNFYRIGYLCPDCGEKLHMVVYPVGKEFGIETSDGAVLLARVCTCARCSSFYTPRPDKMLSEGDIYRLDFEDDRKAYEDYLELIGKRGQRGSSYRYNMFADGHKEQDALQNTAEEDLEEVCSRLDSYDEEQLCEISDKIEEGFFSEESIARCEKLVRKQLWKRGLAEKRREKEKRRGFERGGKENEFVYGNEEQERDGAKKVTEAGKDELRWRKPEIGGLKQEKNGEKNTQRKAETLNIKETESFAEIKNIEQCRPMQKADGNMHGADTESDVRTVGEADAIRKKYEARFQVLERLSERQMSDLKNQIRREIKLTDAEKQNYIGKIERRQQEQKAEIVKKKIESCSGKNYAVQKKVFEEIKKEELPETMKEELLKPLRETMCRQAEAEVKILIEKMPPKLDRARFCAYEERLRDYSEVNLEPYEALLREKRIAAEQQEVANIVSRARKSTRSEIKELMEKLQKGDYLQETVEAYLEKLEECLQKMDQAAVEELLGDTLHMDYEAGQQAYDTILNGDFLPEIRDNALKMLEKRLAKIKSDECELLVKKLQDECAEKELLLNDRHHFYPARKVLLKQALPEETEVIDMAMASYAAGRGMFEYPILVVDTSRSGNGKEGFILTPEHLYYSTWMTSFGMHLFSIEKITASAGLLNRGLYVHQTDGTKTKIPYAVEHKELAAFAEELDAFVRYLQEKPDSRKVAYLAKEKHDTICCYRCGYIYKEGDICPKCGFQNNG